MAVKKTVDNIPAPDMDDRVEVMIPRGSANDDPNFLVSVNGKNYLMPRGKKALVPQHVAYEIRRSFAAQEAQEIRMQKMIEAAQEAAAGMGRR